MNERLSNSYHEHIATLSDPLTIMSLILFPPLSLSFAFGPFITASLWCVDTADGQRSAITSSLVTLRVS